MSPSIESFLARAESKLDGFAESIARKAQDAEVQAHLGLMELMEQWRLNESAMLRSAAKIKAVGQTAKGELDLARVKAHLAKDDALDAAASLKERLHHIEGRLAFLKTSLAHDSHAALDQVESACRHLQTELDA